MRILNYLVQIYNFLTIIGYFLVESAFFASFAFIAYKFGLEKFINIHISYINWAAFIFIFKIVRFDVGQYMANTVTEIDMENNNYNDVNE